MSSVERWFGSFIFEMLFLLVENSVFKKKSFLESYLSIVRCLTKNIEYF